MGSIALNARFYSHAPTGMQRYGIEMAKRLERELEIVKPGKPLRGAEGHLWEQLYLPAASRGRLLWSPNNTGPIAVSRQVCTIHDIIPIDRPDWFSPRFSAWYQWLLPKLVHRVRHIIAVSEFTRQRLIERFKVQPAKVTTVWNGVDEDFHPRTAFEIERVRRELGIESARYLLCVGSLEPRKNLPRLLRAWKNAAPTLPWDTQLVIAGRKPSTRVFADLRLESAERVHFTGYVKQEELPALYSGALALIYPSLYEGFGLPPLEAMACGAAVVTSNGTSVPEVVGNAALLVDPENTGALADAMHRIVVNDGLRQTLRTKGLIRARKFGWERCARETRDVLAAFA
jgi:glycosyltransferase involved in cell wall biosynthesis